MNAGISLVGFGQTKFGELWGKSPRDLLDEAIANALEASSCTALDIDMVIVANMLGEATSNQVHLGALASSLLPHHPPALRVEAACASGAVALSAACALLESGKVETILVVGVEKMTDVSPEAISAALMGAADSELDQPSGLTFPGIFGLIAQRYMYEYGLTREQLNLVSTRHHRNALLNPFAQFQKELTPEEVSQSPIVADPLCLLDCSPVSDGAAACVLSTKHTNALHIAASQLANDTLSITQRPSITSFPATIETMDKALKEAGVERGEIASIETHDCFSIATLINLEDLGFAEPGSAITLYEHEEQYPRVNASGGLKACGHPVAATGIKQVIDVAKSLKESGNRFGLAHNFGGACATCAIHILENTSVS